MREQVPASEPALVLAPERAWVLALAPVWEQGSVRVLVPVLELLPVSELVWGRVGEAQAQGMAEALRQPLKMQGLLASQRVWILDLQWPWFHRRRSQSLSAHEFSPLQPESSSVKILLCLSQLPPLPALALAQAWVLVLELVPA